MLVMLTRYDDRPSAGDASGAVPDGMGQTSGMAQAARTAPQVPSIELGDFQLSVHRRQFPDAEDRWDGNWLWVTAQCAQAGAIVAAGGPILETADLQRFRDQLDALRGSGHGAAELRGAEPNVVVRVAASDGLGRLRVRVELTPDPQVQGHWFAYGIDPSYLPATIEQLDAALALFPVRGQPSGPPPDLD